MIEGARLLVLGRQGAGKGTQCGHLARHFRVPHISSGDVLRAAVKTGTDVGRAAQRFMIAGDLVPDTIVIGAVADRLSQPDASGRGFVLDGFPRTVPQARVLFELLDEQQIDAAVNIDVPAKVVLRRIAARRVCEQCGTMAVAPAGEAVVRCVRCGGDAVQRHDDTPDAIARRLAIYDSENKPLLDWLEQRDLLVTVDGVGSADEVARRVLATLRASAVLGMAEAG